MRGGEDNNLEGGRAGGGAGWLVKVKRNGVAIPEPPFTFPTKKRLKSVVIPGEQILAVFIESVKMANIFPS